MRFIILFLFLNYVHADDNFKAEAIEKLKSVKQSFMKEMTSAIAKSGPYGAVDTCHLKAPHLIENNYGGKFIIRRASSKFRNKDNKPPKWIKPILEKYEDSNAENPVAANVYEADGSKVYVEPIYIKGICLQCHGQPVESVQKKLNKLYPKDLATGYKLGEFRGVFYVKELKE